MSEAEQAGHVPVQDLLDLGGKVAVVTGAAGGIGGAIVDRLSEAGAAVWAVDVNAVALEAVCERFAARAVSNWPLDITDVDAVRALAHKVSAQSGAIDIWVNVAGTAPRASALEITEEQWDAVLNVNLRAAFFAAQAAARHMVDRGRGGVIVNIATSAVHRVSGNPLHYRSAKTGLVAMTQSLAVELGRNGIRVVAVAPTLVETPQVQELREAGDGAGFDEFVRRLPLRRIGQPDDVARVVLFAVSDMADFVTGTVLDVDGGQSYK